jgi:hypothetical protein
MFLFAIPHASVLQSSCNTLQSLKSGVLAWSTLQRHASPNVRRNPNNYQSYSLVEYPITRGLRVRRIVRCLCGDTWKVNPLAPFRRPFTDSVSSQRLQVRVPLESDSSGARKLPQMKRITAVVTPGARYHAGRCMLIAAHRSALGTPLSSCIPTVRGIRREVSSDWSGFLFCNEVDDV